MRVLQDQGYPGVLCVEVDCLRESWEEDDAVVMSVDYLRTARMNLQMESFCQCRIRRVEPPPRSIAL